MARLCGRAAELQAFLACGRAARLNVRARCFAIPPAVIKIIFGKMGEEVLLSGTAVEPASLQMLNFDFEFKSLEDLLRFELGHELF